MTATASEVDRRAAEALRMALRRDNRMPTIVAVEYVMESGVERDVAVNRLCHATADYLRAFLAPNRYVSPVGAPTYRVVDVGYYSRRLLDDLEYGHPGAAEHWGKIDEAFGEAPPPNSRKPNGRWRWWDMFRNVARRAVEFQTELRELP